VLSIGSKAIPTDMRGPSGKRRLRVIVFLATFAVVAFGGLLVNFLRDPVYRATARLSVEPPGVVEEPAIRTQFALSEAQVLRSSTLIQAAAAKLVSGQETADAERFLSVDLVPQTSVIELRAEGNERIRLVNALQAWIAAYLSARKSTDVEDRNEALEEARHAAREAARMVDVKRREMEGFRQAHGISSVEREENPGAARLKGVLISLNEAEAKEVAAEARLKSIDESIAQGKVVIRTADKPALSSLEMRAVELRERIKDLEHDYTPQYLALEPRFRSLKANLVRIEQQIQGDRERSQKAALLEAQEEHVAARRATQKIREQVNALKQETQVFSVRFVELKRMGEDLQKLQDASREASVELVRLESARKPSAARIRVLSAPSAGEQAVWPDYRRDAAIVLVAAMLLAIAAVWLIDYLKREPQDPTSGQPLIQIAYPVLNTPPQSPVSLIERAPDTLLLGNPGRKLTEVSEEDVRSLWGALNSQGRIALTALFNGIAPDELTQLRWAHVSLDDGHVDVPGSCARRLPILDPLKRELDARVAESLNPESFILADVAGSPIDRTALDSQFAYAAHDTGLRNPEEISTEALYFTYAAFLARQGIKMTELDGLIGRIPSAIGIELMRLTKPGRGRSIDEVDLAYPALRTS